jgi:hypothetical protein
MESLTFDLILVMLGGVALSFRPGNELNDVLLRELGAWIFAVGFLFAAIQSATDFSAVSTWIPYGLIILGGIIMLVMIATRFLDIIRIAAETIRSRR